MGTYQSVLKNKGFPSFLTTQFLGAFNDNVYKTVVSLLVVDEATGGGLLSLAAIIFLIPSILFSGYAGYFADKFKKNRVLMITKSLEIIAMFLAFFIFRIGDNTLMLVVLFIMATQSAFFSPAKYGIVPEALKVKELSLANGLLELLTFFAIIFGTACGGILLNIYADDLDFISIFLITIAVIGFVTSFGITNVKPAKPHAKFNYNPFKEVYDGCLAMFKDRELFIVIIAISFFWGLGMAVQLNIFLFGKQVAFGAELQPLNDFDTALLNVALALGIAFGGLFSGWLSGDKIETGIIPIGISGLSIGAFVVGFSAPHIYLVYSSLFVTGFFAGIYIVPLNAMLQDRPKKSEKGRLIATNNFINALAMLIASGFIWLMRSIIGLTPDTIFLMIAVVCSVFTFIITYYLPEGMVRLILWVLTHTLYRINIIGAENVPREGGALIICNHVSYIDGVMVGASVPRLVRYLVFKPIYDMPFIHRVLKMLHAVPIDTSSRKGIDKAILKVRQQLQAGEVVCVFAEGAITRTGNMLPFKRGFESMVKDIDVPIIPVHLDKLWSSIFSFKNNQPILRLPEAMPVKVTVSFGKKMPSNCDAYTVRNSVMELGATSRVIDAVYNETIPERFLQYLKSHAFKKVAEDSYGKSLTGQQLVREALQLSRYIKKTVPANKPVGIILLPSVNNLVVNAAIAISGCFAVNLPYEADHDELQSLCDNDELQIIITSKGMLDKLKMQQTSKMLLVSTLLATSKIKNILTLAMFYATPKSIYIRYFGRRIGVHSPLAVLFHLDAGRVVKKILVSHSNVISNITAFNQIYREGIKQKLFTGLASYSAFGYVYSLWFPVIMRMQVFYQHSPRDIYYIADTMEKHRINTLIEHSENITKHIALLENSRIANINKLIITGDLSRTIDLEQIEKVLSAEVVTSYGLAEMTAMLTVNMPNFISHGVFQKSEKDGSIGLPLPGTVLKIINKDTLEPVALGEKGIMLVKGAGLMLGSWDDTNKGSQTTLEGWFNTGITVFSDSEGFIYLA